MLTTTVTRANRARPITDWYTLPAWDISPLVVSAIEEFGVPVGGTVLDPFCGAGDGLLAAKLSGRNAVGMEANPFLSFAARAKTREYSLPQLRVELDRLLNVGAETLDRLDKDGDLQWQLASRMPKMPRLQSWVANQVVWKVLALRECIEECVSEENRDLPLLALASVLRGASHMRLSPHAYGSRESKPYTPVLYHFDAKLRKMLGDLEWAEEQEGLGSVVVDEGRRTTGEWLEAPADLVVTAPPSLSEPDPTLQTRLELFFFGHVADMGDLERLKKRISLHEMVASSNAARRELLAAVEQVAEAIDVKSGRGDPPGRPASGGSEVRSYFGALFRSLEEMRGLLAPQAHIVMALGECVISGVHIPLPDIAAELAQVAGYERKEVRVLHTRRHPAHKGGLKECAVIVHKA